jgi:hypothetical protein
MFGLLLFVVFAYFFIGKIGKIGKPTVSPMTPSLFGVSEATLIGAEGDSALVMTPSLFGVSEAFSSNVVSIECGSSGDCALVDLLVNNPPDNYYDSFTDLDLKARGVKTLDEYLKKIKMLCRRRVNDAHFLRDIIDDCTKRVSLDKDKYYWVSPTRFYDLPWKIAIVDDSGDFLYEYGFPHTRGDVIVIPTSIIKDNDKFVNTLLHEKLHVYQKMYPADFQKYLDSEGFVRYCRRREIQNVAANPDADSWVYMKDGDVFVGRYDNRTLSMFYSPIDLSKYDCPQEFSIE